jgi:hypothetical protein
MRHLLNERTGTVHKPYAGATDREATCGALQHVPRHHVTSVTNDGQAGDWMEVGDSIDVIDGIETDEGVQRCGRCFDDAGGY